MAAGLQFRFSQPANLHWQKPKGALSASRPPPLAFQFAHVLQVDEKLQDHDKNNFSLANEFVYGRRPI